jgi:hypothetical protein
MGRGGHASGPMVERSGGRGLPGMTSRRPIFIIGTERSGSNLLRTILDAHPAIAAPHPPHILHIFGPVVDSYAPLDDPARFRRLADAVARLVRWHIHPWQPVSDGAALVAAASSQTLIGLADAVYASHLRWRGRERWACKSTFNVRYVDALRDHYPDARFLWLVRDPRDVVASTLRSVFGPSSAAAGATLWREQQELGWRASAGGTSADVLTIRYEDLVMQPDPTVQRICAFLDEPFDARMLAPHETAFAQQTARLASCWQGLARPIFATSTQRFANELGGEDVRTVEAIAGPRMVDFGYLPTLTPAPGGRAASATSDLVLRRVPRRVAIEARSLFSDRNAMIRWRRRLLLATLHLRSTLHRLHRPAAHG